jgi:hypothetical protein
MPPTVSRQRVRRRQLILLICQFMYMNCSFFFTWCHFFITYTMLQEKLSTTSSSSSYSIHRDVRDEMTRTHTRILGMLYLLLPDIVRREKRNYLIAGDVPSLASSAWRVLHTSSRDEAFIQEMSVDTKVFKILLELFVSHPAVEYIYRKNNLSRSGAVRDISPVDHLAIVLHYFRSRSTQSQIGRLFGLTQSQVSRYVKEGVIILLHQLRNHYPSRIKWPTNEELHEFSELAKLRDDAPDVAGVIGFLDGLKLPVKEPIHNLLQNMYFSGYTRRCEVTNVILFTLDGCIAYANINNPGAVSDSEMAQGVYRRLANLDDDLPYKIVADSAFSSYGLDVRVLKPKTQQQPISSLAEGRAHARITSLRQGVEWGMRTVQTAFLRLNAGLPLDTNQRQNYIEFCLRLHNLNTRESIQSRNQIRTVFSASYIPNIWAIKFLPHQQLSQFYRLSEIQDFQQIGEIPNVQEHVDEDAMQVD